MESDQFKTESILRLYKHEMVNLSASLSRAINDYLGNPRLKDIDSRKIKNVYQDASSTLSMFEFLSKNIGILVDDPIPPNMKNVRFYHDLLYKWENIKRVDAREKGCEFVFQKSSVNIFTDPNYAELVVYNLLTNAVKYAYDNTKIYVHCEKIPENNQYVLSVTNFTFSISRKDASKIFEIGYRAEEARNNYPEGSGIGLWIVSKSMEQMGGKVVLCEPKLISNYNIPLLHAYINHSHYYDTLISNEVQKKIKDEHDRLAKTYCFCDFGYPQDALSWIVSDYNWSHPAKSKFLMELNEPTYVIKFEVYFDEENLITR